MSENKKNMLEKNLERFDFYIEKADNKASFLLAFAGALIGTILLEIDRIIGDNYKILIIHLLILTTCALVISIIYSLLVIIPRMPKMSVDSCMFFSSIKDISLSEYKDKINNLNSDEKIIIEYENETYELARVCNKKMLNMRKSLIALTTSIIFIIIIIVIKILTT